MKALLSLPLTTQYFLLLAFVVIPVLGVAGYFRYRSGKPLRAKRERYRAMIVTQCIILLITISAAQLQHLQLFGRNWGARRNLDICGHLFCLPDRPGAEGLVETQPGAPGKGAPSPA